MTVGGTNKKGAKRGPNKRISVRPVRRDQIDLRKLSRALLDLAQAEIDAETELKSRRKPSSTSAGTQGGDDDDSK